LFYLKQTWILKIIIM